jgi:hypothetical protein
MAIAIKIYKSIKIMSQKSVFCIATSHAQADQIIDQLKYSGFSNFDISALFPDEDAVSNIVYDKSSAAPEDIITGIGMGGALGWTTVISVLVIPKVGSFIAAGSIVKTLSDVAIGVTVGGITGGLINLGMPDITAKLYENKIKEGNIVVSVHTKNSKEIFDASDIFDEAEAQHICVTGKTFTPNTKISNSEITYINKDFAAHHIY